MQDERNPEEGEGFKRLNEDDEVEAHRTGLTDDEDDASRTSRTSLTDEDDEVEAHRTGLTDDEDDASRTSRTSLTDEDEDGVEAHRMQRLGQSEDPGFKH